MANNINPLKFGVTGQYFKQETQEDLNKNSAKEETAQAKEEKQVSSNEVLGFLAAQNADMIPVRTQKTLDVSKYVTEEQEARIEEFMKGFEADYDEAVEIAGEEFPGISDELAGDLALAYINSSY